MGPCFFVIIHFLYMYYTSNMRIFKPLDRMIGGILFLSCLFVCLSVCLFVFLLSTLTFTITFELHICHAYSTNDPLSNDTKVNNLVTLTLTL